MAASRLLGQFRISGEMRPYLLRIRLRGSDFDFGATPESAAAFTRCVGEMRRILLEKGRIQAIAADRAILKTLEAAFDFQFGPARKRGAPYSVAQVFASRAATIWRSLGLNPGLAYNFNLHPTTADRIGHGGRVESLFQRYCRAALTAVWRSPKDLGAPSG